MNRVPPADRAGLLWSQTPIYDEELIILIMLIMLIML